MKNPDPNPEDEAFEELALKQGQWKYTSGWRKKQIVETDMTQDEIIEMARQAGIVVTGEAIYTLCKLVAAKEREACAKIIESHGPTLANGLMLTNAIRARGQA